MGRRNRVDDNTLFFVIPELAGTSFSLSEKVGQAYLMTMGSNISKNVLNPGYQFMGINAELDAGDDAAEWTFLDTQSITQRINAATNFSFEFWFTAPTADAVLLSTGHTLTYFNVKYTLATKKISIVTSLGTTTFNYVFPTSESQIYVAITHETSTDTIKLYVDGRLVDEQIDGNAYDGWSLESKVNMAVFQQVRNTVGTSFYMNFFSDARVSDKIRTPREIIDVYNRGCQVSIRDTKPRIRLQERDSHTGSYPSRVFNSQEFSGKYISYFHDSDMTVTFNSSSRLSFPMNRASGSIHLLGKKHLNTHLYGQGNVVKGIADDGLSFTPGQDLSPFDESNKFAAFAGKATSDSFWLTGSSVQNVGLGFAQPVFSKKKIELDLSSQVMTTLTASTTNSLSYPMAYYNFDTRRWDGIGTGHELGATTVTGGEITGAIKHTMIGFANTSIVGYKDGVVDNFGFPLHVKFHATSSQLLDASNTITRPFLLEKMVLEFSASLSSSGRFPGTIDSTNMSPGMTFFMLRQQGPFSGTIALPFEYSGGYIVPFSASFPGTMLIGSSSITVDTVRELITYTNIKAFGSNVTQDYYDLYKGDLNIVLPNAGALDDDMNNVFVFPQQKLILSSSCKASSKYTANTNALAISQTNSVAYGSYRYGGRFNIPLMTAGREINSAFSNGQLISQTNAYSLATPLVETNNVSPYIIYPNDKLVFGLQGSTIPDGFSPDTGYKWTFAFKAGGSFKIILYGSEISEDKETNQTLAQPLTSDAIHETIGFDPLFDQHDCEPSYFLSGAYTDDIVSGKMVTQNGASLTTSTRKVIGSKRFRKNSLFTIDDATTRDVQTSTVSQSLSRVIECMSSDERFYDTVLPDPYQYALINRASSYYMICRNSDTYLVGYAEGLSEYMNGVTCHSYTLSDYCTAINSGTMYFDTKYRGSFPFEPRYSTLTRVPDFSLTVPRGVPTTNVASQLAPDAVTSLIGKSVNDLLVLMQVDNSNAVLHSYVSNGGFTYPVSVTGAKSFNRGFLNDEFKQLNLFRKAFYGIGDLGVYGTPSGLIQSESVGHTHFNTLEYHYEPTIRGWKYGILNGAPQFSKAHFRRDHFGQFRDMLEQRLDSKFAIVDLNEYLEENVQKKTKIGSARVVSSPINVSFIDLTTKQHTDPYNTRLSSNISIECTSSLPYYDDNVARNR